MKNQFDQLEETHAPLEEQQGGFMLTELLAVVAAVALVALVALPAFAGARTKGARALCGSNLHQMFAASMVYANEFGAKLPPWRAGMGTQMNDVWTAHYTRWVYAWQPGFTIPRSFIQPPNSSFENMGYLYGANLVGDGNIFYCPALLTGVFSASYYSPLLTADSSGAVRCSYYYNPRIINWDSSVGPVDTHRRYPTTTQFEPHRVFGLDAMILPYAHSTDQGFNVVFTDGSVKFCRGTSSLVAQLASGGLDDADFANREQLFDLFEGM